MSLIAVPLNSALSCVFGFSQRADICDHYDLPNNLPTA